MTSASVASERKRAGERPALDESLKISSDNVVRPSIDRKVATIRLGNQEVSFTKKDGSAFTEGKDGELVALNEALANAKTNEIDSKLQSIAEAGISGLEIAVISLDGRSLGNITDSKILGIPLSDNLTIKNAFLAKGNEFVFDGNNLTCENVRFISKNALVLRKERAGRLHFKGCTFPEGVNSSDHEQARIYKRKHAFRLVGNAERLVLENTVPSDRSHMIDQSMLSLRKDGHRTQIQFRVTTDKARGELQPDAIISLYKGSFFKDKNAPKLAKTLEEKIARKVAEETLKVRRRIDSLTEAFKGINQEFEIARDKALSIASRLDELKDRTWPLIGAWRHYLEGKLEKATKELKPLQDELNEKKKELIKEENTRRYLDARLANERECKKCIDVSLSEGRVLFTDEGSEKVKSLKDSLSLRPREFGAKLESDFKFIRHISEYAGELSKALMKRLVNYIDQTREQNDKQYAGCPDLCGVYDLNVARELFRYYIEQKEVALRRLEEKLKGASSASENSSEKTESAEA